MKLLSVAAVALLAAQAAGASIKHRLNGFTILEHPDPAKRDLLQDIVVIKSESLAMLHSDYVNILTLCRLHGMTNLCSSMERGLCYSAEKCILSGTLAPRTSMV